MLNTQGPLLFLVHLETICLIWVTLFNHLNKIFLFKHERSFSRFGGEFGLKVTIVLLIPPGICRDCRKSVLESSVSSVAGITSTDMEEQAACATPLADLESLSRTLGHVTLVWTITLQYTDTVTIVI